MKHFVFRCQLYEILPPMDGVVDIGVSDRNSFRQASGSTCVKYARNVGCIKCFNIPNLHTMRDLYNFFNLDKTRTILVPITSFQRMRCMFIHLVINDNIALRVVANVNNSISWGVMSIDRNIRSTYKKSGEQCRIPFEREIMLVWTKKCFESQIKHQRRT